MSRPTSAPVSPPAPSLSTSSKPYFNPLSALPEAPKDAIDVALDKEMERSIQQLSDSVSVEGLILVSARLLMLQNLKDRGMGRSYSDNIQALATLAEKYGHLIGK